MAGKLYCFLQWNEAFGESFSYVNYFLLVTFILFYYIPIAVLVILYSIIVIKLKKQKIPGQQSVNAEQQRAKRNRNVLKLAIAIVVGFVLCWVPSTTIVLVSLFARDLPCGFWLYYYITFAPSPSLWLSRIVPSTLASVSVSVQTIVRDLRAPEVF